jgi:hypothetical protein
MLRKVAASLVVLISLTACGASYAVKQNPAAGYSFKHKDFDFWYAWEIGHTDKGMSIDGLIKNVRYNTVEDADVKVSLLNKAHQVISEDVTFLFPPVMKIDDYRSFRLLLKNAKLSEGDLLQFLVNYRASEGSQNGSAWRGSFIVNAATGSIVGIQDNAANQW